MTMQAHARAAAPGRPREFDLDDAVRDALEVFRQRGYHGASMVDLLEGTKLSRGSLYKAFPDKRALFFAAFDLYAREALERLAREARPGHRPRRHSHGAAALRPCLRAGLLAEGLPDLDRNRRVAAR